MKTVGAYFRTRKQVKRVGLHHRVFLISFGSLVLFARISEAPSSIVTETGLAGWGDETRTPESVGNRIHLNWRHNFRGFGWNCAAETVRVRAAALRICSSRKDFGRRCPRGRWSRQLGAESHLVGGTRTAECVKKKIRSCQR